MDDFRPSKKKTRRRTGAHIKNETNGILRDEHIQTSFKHCQNSEISVPSVSIENNDPICKGMRMNVKKRIFDNFPSQFYETAVCGDPPFPCNSN